MVLRSVVRLWDARSIYVRESCQGHSIIAVKPEYHPALYNEDLAPVPLGRRSWGTYNYASLWVAMSVCIPTYMLASGLIAGGMNWWQAVGTILLGNLIVLEIGRAHV